MSFGVARTVVAARGAVNPAHATALMGTRHPEPQTGAPQHFLRRQQLKQRSQPPSRGLRAAAAVVQAPAEAALQEAVVDVELPTSAESEELLRIRHSVGWDNVELVAVMKCCRCCRMPHVMSLARPYLRCPLTSAFSAPSTLISVHTSWPWRCSGYTRMHV